MAASTEHQPWYFTHCTCRNSHSDADNSFTALARQAGLFLLSAKAIEPVTYLIVSVGVMFTIGGLIRFIIGPADRVFTDGQRFLLKARAFKKMTGLNEGLP